MSDEDSRIDKLRDQLYSREYKQEDSQRTEISTPKMDGVRSSWEKEEPKPQKAVSPKKPEGFYIKWLLIISIMFFVVSFAVAAFIFIRGGAISTKNVDVRILGPVSVGGGEELSLEVIVDNGNNVDIESASVELEYPVGTRTADNLDEDFKRDQKEYGPIPAGGNARKTFKSILFGEQDTIKEIKANVEYRVQGSSATFKKEKIYEVKISSSPVLVSIDYPNQVRTNQEVEFIVDITSNSSQDLRGVLLKASYPHGFAFEGSDPGASFDSNNLFAIGNLGSEEKRTVKIRGVLQAQDNEERTFRFEIGTENSDNRKELGAVYVMSDKTITITKPSLGLFATVDGSSSGEVVVRSGQSISTVISWFNNLEQRVVNGSIDAVISGSMIDRQSVVVSGGGFYRSSDDTVFWNQNSQRTLSDISPGEKDSVSFGFKVKDLTTSLASSLRNPEIDVDIRIEGNRFSEGGVPDKVNTEISKKIKIASDLNLSTRSVYSTGPIQNSGPIPPRVEEPTTYTIIWSLTNSYNDLKNVKVVGQLPPYVSWENNYSPSSENLVFSQTTNQVVWEVPNLPAGTGFNSSPKEVAFQVEIIPSLSQVDTSPVLIQTSRAEGNDSFAGFNVSDTAGPVTTLLPSDPNVSVSQGRVVN